MAIKIDEISSLSVHDYICISATYFCLLNQIKDEKPKLKRRGYSELQLRNIEKNKKSEPSKINNLLFTRSMTDFKYDQIGFLLTLFENYELGNLPDNGSISDQPGQVMEMLSVLKSLQIDHRNKIQNEQLKNIKRK